MESLELKFGCNCINQEREKLKKNEERKKTNPKNASIPENPTQRPTRTRFLQRTPRVSSNLVSLHVCALTLVCPPASGSPRVKLWRQAQFTVVWPKPCTQPINSAQPVRPSGSPLALFHLITHAPDLGLTRCTQVARLMVWPGSFGLVQA